MPAARGLKFTLIAQLVPAASEVPHVLLWPKSAPFVPEMLIEVMVNVALPVLLRVTTLAGLAVFTAWFANVMLPGDRAVTGAIPVPVRGTVCGLPKMLSLTAILAVRLPVAVGLKLVLMVQDLPGASVAPHVWVCAKSPLLVPVMAMLWMVRAAVPVLLSVTVAAELVVPTV